MRKLFIGMAVFITVAAVFAALAIDQSFTRTELPYRAYGIDGVFVDIQPGESSGTIAKSLASAGVVRDEWTFRLAVWRSGLARDLQAGEYYFNGELSSRQVADTIASGQVYLRPITFPEGLTVSEMADIFNTRGFGDREAFLEEVQRVELISALDSDAKTLEGYLFPETYLLPRDATASDLVEAMVTQFRQTFSEAVQEEAFRHDFSVREVVTLASLIQKETGSAGEHRIVSAVYNNRLRIGMALQCDPTVIYALQLDGLYDGNLTRDNLQHDSPYNTYRYPGLPPGPIAAPGLGALSAAVDPEDVSYLYFVSRNDGSHEFANTLREHNRNVQRYQVDYFRARRRSQSTERN